jgi:hypothetical protein
MRIFLLLISVTLVTAGCTVDSDDPVAELGVPKGALAVEEGSGRLTYKPERDGRVYVYDIEDDRLVLEQPINANEEFVVDARDNRIMLNDKRVTERDLKSNHRHRIYFRRKR